MTSFLASLKAKLKDDAPSVEQDISSNENYVVVQHQAVSPIVQHSNLLNDESVFFLSQTTIKEITNRHHEYNPICPRRFYELFIKRNYEFKSAAMLEGLYAESLMLGSSAKGQVLTDLPRHKKSNEKLSAQKNIEEQAIRFPIFCSSKGININKGVATQFPIAKVFTDYPSKRKIIIRTELDIFPTTFYDNNNIHLAVIDLKLTADINTKFGNYCWGAPEFIDHLQADITYWLLQDFDYDLNVSLRPDKKDVYDAIFKNSIVPKLIENEQIIFVYMVIGYKKQPLEEQVTFIRRNYRDPNGGLLRQKDWKERARKTLAQISLWNKEKFQPIAGTYCNACPVNVKNGGYCTVGTETVVL